MKLKQFTGWTRVATLCLAGVITIWFLTRESPLQPWNATAGRHPSPGLPKATLETGGTTSTQVEPHSTPGQAGSLRAMSPGNISILQHPEEAPAWAVGYGKEFWRRPEAGANRHRAGRKAADAALKLPASVNLGDVIERVSHALEMEPDSRRLHTQTKTYEAWFDGTGLRLSPFRPTAEAQGVALASDRLHAPSATEPLPPAWSESGGVEPPRDHAVFGEPDPETEARFRTLAIRQKTQVLYASEADAVEWSVLGNTAQALLNSGLGLVEHYETRGEGVAVTWVVTKPLPEGGPLSVEAGLTGLTYVGWTTNGHHFADASGTARLVIGKVTAVDAAGRNWDLAMEAEPSPDGARMEVTVPQTILAQATYPLTIDPVIGPEFGMDEPVPTAIPEFEYTPSVASCGTDYLVVWFHNAPSPAIQAVRLNSTGVLRDVTPIVVTGSPCPQALRPVAVAANGRHYLVVWRDARNFPTQIRGARVTQEGVVLEPNGILLSKQGSEQAYPTVASNGDAFLAVWQTRSTTGVHVYGARVSNDGLVLETNGISIGPTNAPQFKPSVAASGNDYLVVWEGYNTEFGVAGVYGARVSASGVVLDTNSIGIATGGFAGYPVAVAGSSNGFLVVWGGVRGRRVSPAGVADSAYIEVGLGGYNPSVATDGRDFLVVWETYHTPASHIQGARVTSAGSVADPYGIAICTAARYQRSPAVAAGAGGYFVVWEDTRNFGVAGRGDVYGARVGNNGTVLDSNGVLVSPDANAENSPAVAFNGKHSLVVWADSRYATNYSQVPLSVFGIYGTRVAGDGSITDPGGIAISRTPGDQTAPAVAAKGTDFLVVWEGRYPYTRPNIFGARVNDDGVLLDTNAILISKGYNSKALPAVASNGTNWLTVWMAPNFYWDIVGARLSGSGEVLDTNAFAISRATNNQTAPAVAANGRDYLVVWEDYRRGSTNSDVYGARVTGDGLLLDTNGIAISTANHLQAAAAVACDSTNYLVVWEDWRNSRTTAKDIYGTRVSFAGAVADSGAIPICTAPKDQSAPAVAFDGIEYLVAWQDWRNNSRLATNALNLDIYGTRVTSLGGVLDASGFAINTNSSNQQLPAVAGGGRRFLVASQGTQYGTNRIVGNLVFAQSPPIALPQAVALDEDTSAAITLAAFDVDGDALAFSVGAPAHGTLTGTPPSLSYRPHTNYYGPDSFTFSVSDGQTNSAQATVTITVRPVNDAPFAKISVSPLAEFTGITNQIILAPVGGDAKVVLDGSESSDVENDPLEYFWSERTNNFASGVKVTNEFAPGSHTVTLTVSDGDATGTAITEFEVLTPAEAVGFLIAAIEDSDVGQRHATPLIAILRNAARSFENGNAPAGNNQLQAFQNKVQAQIAPTHPTLAAQWIAEAQQIIMAASNVSSTPLNREPSHEEDAVAARLQARRPTAETDAGQFNPDQAD